MHPQLYKGPRMVKPPVVYIAGMLRAIGRGVDTDSWTWIGHLMGQQLFRPPNVAGWDDERWLDTSTWRGRWIAATNARAACSRSTTSTDYPEDERSAEAVDSALAFWGNPTISTRHPQEARGVRRALPRRRRPALEAGALPAPAPERAAHADRDVPRPPHDR